METVAESVETQEELKHILNIGLDYAQGYLWSKPTPFDETLYFLKNTEEVQNKHSSIYQGKFI